MNITELNSLIFDSGFEKIEASERAKILAKRKELLNKSFEWSDENIKKIEKINDRLLQAMNEAYSKVVAVKSDLNKLTSLGSHLFEYYFIAGGISIDACCNANDSYANKLLVKLTAYSPCRWQIIADVASMPDKDKCFFYDKNLDTEIFAPIKNKNVQICNATQSIFVDDNVLSLQDMTNLKEEDIFTNVEISI